MNGYFQVQVNEKGVSLILSPPVGEGEKIRVTELKESAYPMIRWQSILHFIHWVRRRLSFF